MIASIKYTGQAFLTDYSIYFYLSILLVFVVIVGYPILLNKFLYARNYYAKEPKKKPISKAFLFMMLGAYFFGFLHFAYKQFMVNSDFSVSYIYATVGVLVVLAHATLLYMIICNHFET